MTDPENSKRIVITKIEKIPKREGGITRTSSLHEALESLYNEDTADTEKKDAGSTAAKLAATKRFFHDYYYNLFSYLYRRSEE